MQMQSAGSDRATLKYDRGPQVAQGVVSFEQAEMQ